MEDDYLLLVNQVYTMNLLNTENPSTFLVFHNFVERIIVMIPFLPSALFSDHISAEVHWWQNRTVINR